jgi:hypothetical protein
MEFTERERSSTRLTHLPDGAARAGDGAVCVANVVNRSLTIAVPRCGIVQRIESPHMAFTGITLRRDGWQSQAEHLALTHTAFGMAAMAAAGQTQWRRRVKSDTRSVRVSAAGAEGGLKTDNKDLKPTLRKSVKLQQPAALEVAAAAGVPNQAATAPVAQIANTRIAELEYELSSTREELAIRENENLSLQMSLDLTVSEESRLSGRLAQAGKRVEDLQGELGLARGGLVLSQNESRLLQASLDLTISENSRLSGRLAQAGKYVEDLEGELGLARGGLARSQNESRLLQTSLDLTISENSRLSRRLVERDAAFNKIRSQLEQIEQALAAAVDETRKKSQAKAKKLNTLLAAMSSRTDAAKRLLAEVKQSLSASTEDNGVVERTTADAMCSTDALLAQTITL